jgi:alpha-tubulin suppressor-like RCC1 family protein
MLQICLSLKRSLSLSLSLLLAFFLSFFLIGCGGGGGGNGGGGGSSGGNGSVGGDNNSSNNSPIITDIVAGNSHSFALYSDGTVYAAGGNYYGQLGFGNNTNSNVFTEVTSLSNITVIAAGTDYSLTLDSDGKVYATGYNNRGQLGFGNNTNSNVFTEVTSLNGKTITAIAAGQYHSLALDINGNLYATGYNIFGTLGLNDMTHRNSFTEVPLPANINIIAMAAGGWHSLILDSNGNIYATGDNYYGTLGLGSTAEYYSFTKVPFPVNVNITAIAAGYDHSLALDSNGKVYVTGGNYCGQLGMGDSGYETSRYNFTEVPLPTNTNIISIAARLNHSIVLDSNGKVYTTGRNDYGQLGLGDTNDRNAFEEVTSLNGKNITAIAAGDLHSFAFANDGKVYATGLNSVGELGLNDTDNRNTFTEVTITR